MEVLEHQVENFVDILGHAFLVTMANYDPGYLLHLEGTQCIGCLNLPIIDWWLLAGIAIDE